MPDNPEDGIPVKAQHIPYVEPNALSAFESRSTYDTVFQAITKYVPKGAKVLDVGCGRGEILELLSQSGYDAYGCDTDDKCVNMGSRYGKVQRLAVEEVSATAFGTEFDCVVMSHVLEHVENPKAAFLQLASVSKGWMVISIPNPYYSPFVCAALLRRSTGHVNATHLYSWDWSHFKTFVESGCGMEVVEWFHDCVAIPILTRFRLPLKKMGVLSTIENGLLKAVLPKFCRSITAVVKVNS